MADCCYSKSCPEPVSTVNVTVNELTGGNPEQEVFTNAGGDLTDNGDGTYSFTLTSTPISEDTVQVALNGVIMNPETDITQADALITVTPPSGFEIDDAVFVVSYISAVI